jgi:cyclopropane-fatty-acyl-phospholipid synthase
MSTIVAATKEPAVQASFDFLRDLFAGYGPRDFAVRAWDGSIWEPDAGQPARFTVVLQHPGAVRKMFWPPSKYTLAEAYIYDDIDIEGDFHAFFTLIAYLRGMKPSLFRRLRYATRLLSLPGGERPRVGRTKAKLSGAFHSPERDREAISYHYDVSNEFYQLWLDRRMVYTCAYFNSPDEDLDTAQERKLDYVCRKLRLQPGERLMDLGCGWGSLVIYAAERYGVRAEGVTLSRRQAEWAQERIRQLGLQDRARVDYRDYRDTSGTYDKLTAICMVEHVGGKLLPSFFRHAYSLLRPGGCFLNQGIVVSGWQHKVLGQPFSNRYVFPDAELKPVHLTIKSAEEAGLEVRDVESLREHYEMTCKHWVRRLDAHAEEAKRLTNETTYRVWRLYMAGSADGFQSSRGNLYQTLMVKPDRGASGLPLTREDWYR